jgi:oligopeptide/dipeptide ABC transporter ATP-binding protein
MRETGATAAPAVQVSELSIEFGGRKGFVKVVDSVSFSVGRGEIVGIVGESGCGKSTTARAMLRLLPLGTRISGSVVVDGMDLLQLPERKLNRVRGRRIGYVPQEAIGSLNPLRRIGPQITEPMRVHLGLGRREAREKAISLLGEVGMVDPARRADDFPHLLSGGMRQRAVIAAALAGEPDIVIADEPTTALDVTLQAQILGLCRALTESRRLAMVLITHDFGVAASVCDRVFVMYSGRIVEEAESRALFERQFMPYTHALLRAAPGDDTETPESLAVIEGRPPEPTEWHAGCRFAPRCSGARERCVVEEPRLSSREGSRRQARCWGTEVDGWLQLT